MKTHSPLLLAALAALLALVALTALPAPLPAAEPASTPVVFAQWYSHIVTDRARLIQVSLVIVAFGIALLWWKK